VGENYQYKESSIHNKATFIIFTAFSYHFIPDSSGGNLLLVVGRVVGLGEGHNDVFVGGHELRRKSESMGESTRTCSSKPYEEGAGEVEDLPLLSSLQSTNLYQRT